MKYNQLFYNYEGIFRYLKLGRIIKQRLQESAPGVHRLLTDAVERRVANSKWRRLGLLKDDLIVEENDVVKEALSRLPRDQIHGRYARAKVALHYNMLRRELPAEHWVKSEQDKSYLLPFVEQVLSEHEERAKYDKGHFVRSQ